MKLSELMNLEEQILNAPMFEMANLSPTDTGLAVVIWIGEVGGQHGPRIKVSNVPGKFAKNDNFVISVSSVPEVLTPKSVKLSSDKVQDVLDWVKLNYTDLMELWRMYESGTGNTILVLAKLKKI